jgi:hypothetical protein
LTTLRGAKLGIRVPAVVAVALVAATVATAAWMFQRDQADAGVDEGRYDLVEVTVQTLRVGVELAGETGYGQAREFPLRAEGTVTWLPDRGTKVRRGEPLMEVDGRPIILMYGDSPAYRTLHDGTENAQSDIEPAGDAGADASTDDAESSAGDPPSPPEPTVGEDVRQFEENLTELG